MRIFFTILAILLFPVSVFSGGFDGSIIPMNLTYSSNSLDDTIGIEARVGHKNVTLDLSLEETNVRFGGQQCAKPLLIGAGIGARTQPYWGFSGYFGARYYDVSYSIYDAFHLDGAQFAFLEFLGPTGSERLWQHYDYKLKDGIGGVIGVSYGKKIKDRLEVGGIADYRYLRLDQSIYGWDGEYDREKPHWEAFRYLDASALRVGVSLKGYF